MGQTERAGNDPVQQALAALADPKRSAVLVVGPPGSGKSRLLSELQAQPDAARHPRLLALDDLDQLAGAELARLAEHLDRRDVRLAGSVRTGAADAVLRDLRPLRPLAVVELRPWGRDRLVAFATEQTGGRLHELTVHRMLRLSGGNPLCLTELLDSGLAGGRLQRVHDVWTWTGPMPVPPVTVARVAGGLARLPAATRDVHATVALAGTLELAVLERVFGAAAVEAAEEAGVLRVEQSGRRLQVRPAVPVEGSVAVQVLPATRRRRLSGALAAELLRQGGRRAADPLGVARLLWDAGAEIPPDLRAPVARCVRRSQDPALAAALLGDRPRPDPALATVAALAAAGRTADAAASARAAGGDAEQDARLRAAAGLVELALGRVEAADRCAAELRETGLAEDWPLAYALGALLGGRCALAAGGARRAAGLLSEGLVPDHGTAVLRPYGLTLLALAHVLAGRTQAADRALLEADRTVVAGEPGILTDLTELARAELLLARGRHSGALRLVTAVAQRCADRPGTLLAALHLWVRIQPSAEVADRLAAAAAAVDAADGLPGLMVRHARAAAAGDGAELAGVAAGYERTGLHWLAAETAAASLACAAPQHRASWAAADRSLLERVDARADVELPELWWRGGDRFAPLTQREREITELAAGGWSSPRIAVHLHLSRRTIENHLQHSYRKLGISRREELAAVLGRRP